MKKIALILVLFIIFINACGEVSEPKPQEAQKEANVLSELQIEACNSADMAKTCDTRLQELGIVIKEDCCEALGKCC